MRFLILLICLGVTGCASHKIQRFSDMDLKEKSITVEPGGQGLLGALKKRLVQEGWDLKTDLGPLTHEGESAETVSIRSYNTFKTRYRLYITYKWIDTCFTSPKWSYDISIIDNQRGSEVFTLTGQDCESSVIDEFIGALSN